VISPPYLFSIIHATNRPYAWQAAYAQYRRMTCHWDQCEFVIVYDEQNERDFHNVLGNYMGNSIRAVVNKGRPCYVDAANEGARLSCSPILVMSTDDMFPPYWWDLKIKEAAESSTSSQKAYFVSCGYRPDIQCMQVLSRAYFDRYGFVFDPAFHSMNGDIDYTYRAERDGVVVDCRDVCWEHQHYHLGKRQQDESDKVNASTERQQEADAEIERRWGPQWATDLDRLYAQSIVQPSDIFEHLPALKQLAARKFILELGVRYGNSTRAFLAGRPECLVSIDTDWSKSNSDTLAQASSQQRVRWYQREGDSRSRATLKCSSKWEFQFFDITFVDTLHTAAQVRSEIAAHEPHTKERLIFHDTVTNGKIGEDGGPGIMVPIYELLSKGDWEIERHYHHCNGLLILRRKGVAPWRYGHRTTAGARAEVEVAV